MNSLQLTASDSDTRRTRRSEKPFPHLKRATTPGYRGSDLQKTLQQEQGIPTGHSSPRGSARELDRKRELKRGLRKERVSTCPSRALAGKTTTLSPGLPRHRHLLAAPTRRSGSGTSTMCAQRAFVQQHRTADDEFGFSRVLLFSSTVSVAFDDKNRNRFCLNPQPSGSVWGTARGISPQCFVTCQLWKPPVPSRHSRLAE